MQLGQLFKLVTNILGQGLSAVFSDTSRHDTDSHAADVYIFAGPLLQMFKIFFLLPVLHSILIREPLDDLGDGGPLLSDGDVNAEELLLVLSGVVEPLLVDDSVDGDGGFAGLTIANDQLTLTTADGHQRVHGLDSGLKKRKHFFF